MDNAMQAAIIILFSIIHYPLFFSIFAAEIKDIQRFNEDI